MPAHRSRTEGCGVYRWLAVKRGSRRARWWSVGSAHFECFGCKIQPSRIPKFSCVRASQNLDNRTTRCSLYHFCELRGARYSRGPEMRSMASNTAKGHDQNNLDFLRLFFALIVIFSHSFAISKGADSLDPLARWTRGESTFGEAAVAFFFIVSGFLISGSWLRSSSASQYLKRRFLRIFPGYICAAAASVFVVAPLSFHTVPYLHGLIVRA